MTILPGSPVTSRLSCESTSTPSSSTGHSLGSSEGSSGVDLLGLGLPSPGWPGLVSSSPGLVSSWPPLPSCEPLSSCVVPSPCAVPSPSVVPSSFESSDCCESWPCDPESASLPVPVPGPVSPSEAWPSPVCDEDVSWDEEVPDVGAVSANATGADSRASGTMAAVAAAVTMARRSFM